MAGGIGRTSPRAAGRPARRRRGRRRFARTNPLWPHGLPVHGSWTPAELIAGNAPEARRWDRPHFTRTGIASLVVVLPAASIATAARRCAPRATFRTSSVAVYGAASSDATTAPSRRNRTRCTPALSEADAVSVADLKSTEPAAGEVSATDGGVVSRTVTLTGSLAPRLPAASWATATSVTVVPWSGAVSQVTA